MRSVALTLFGLLFLLPTNAEEILLDRLICASGVNDGEWSFRRCNRYPETDFFPFCVYMVVPSNETHAGWMIHDCVYSHRLPQQCIDKYDYFNPSITLNIRGESVTGAMMCCMDDYCNQMEDPVFSIVRLKDDSNDMMKESWPILVFVLVVVAGLMPLVMSAIHDRQRRSQVLAEQASRLPDDLNPLNVTEFPMDVTPKFANLRELNDVLKEFDKKHRHPVNVSMEETDAAIFNDVYLLQQDATVTSAVLRSTPSKLSSLAQRMVEHGPFEFEFDPIELGDLFDSVAQILVKEPTLLELTGDFMVIGNLQGNYADLFRWFNLNGWPPRNKVLFLGGLTSDDNQYSLETIALIFALKKELPNHVFILRGAAETYPIKIKRRFSRCVSKCVSDVILRCCGFLPLAARISESIFCCHGGLRHEISKWDEIRDIRRPLHNIRNGTLAADIIFSQIDLEKGNGHIPGSRGIRFDPGSTEYQTLFKNLGIQVMIRGRNPTGQGFHIAPNYVITLWSTPCENVSQGDGYFPAAAAAVVDHEKMIRLSKLAKHGFFTRDKVTEFAKQEADKEKKQKKVKKASVKDK